MREWTFTLFRIYWFWARDGIKGVFCVVECVSIGPNMLFQLRRLFFLLSLSLGLFIYSDRIAVTIAWRHVDFIRWNPFEYLEISAIVPFIELKLHNMGIRIRIKVNAIHIYRCFSTKLSCFFCSCWLQSRSNESWWFRNDNINWGERIFWHSTCNSTKKKESHAKS